MSLGHCCLLKEFGRQASGRMKAGIPGVVLLDFAMPELTVA